MVSWEDFLYIIMSFGVVMSIIGFAAVFIARHYENKKESLEKHSRRP
ncbi:MAG: hypothetical protein AB1797_06195 [bacterium]